VAVPPPSAGGRSIRFLDREVELLTPVSTKFSLIHTVVYWAGIALSVQAGRSGDRIPVGDEIFRTLPDQPWGPQWVPGLSRG